MRNATSFPCCNCIRAETPSAQWIRSYITASGEKLGFESSSVVDTEHCGFNTCSYSLFYVSGEVALNEQNMDNISSRKPHCDLGKEWWWHPLYYTILDVNDVSLNLKAEITFKLYSSWHTVVALPANLLCSLLTQKFRYSENLALCILCYFSVNCATGNNIKTFSLIDLFFFLNKTFT